MSANKYIVITPFFPTEKSFRGPFIYDQVRAIQRNSSYEVIVFRPVSIAQMKVDYYDYNGVRVYYFPFLQMPSNILSGVLDGINNLLFINVVKRLHISFEDISVVHSHTVGLATLALALKEKNKNIVTMVQHHDPDPYCVRWGKFAKKTWNLLYKAKHAKKIFERMDVHISVSKYVETNLLKFPGCSDHDMEPNYLEVLGKLTSFKGANIKKSIVLYNGVDLNLFKPKPCKHEDFVIGCVGNMGEWKDQLTLIKAIEKIVKEGNTDIFLKLMGSGKNYKSLVEYVDKHNLSTHIEFLPEVHHEYLPSFLNSIDLFVLPSFFEGFGCVFTEAAACGVPFMTCKGQGASEYISPDELESWTIEPHDFKTLCYKILNYKKHRYKQHLCYSLSIDLLIRDFLQEIKCKT